MAVVKRHSVSPSQVCSAPGRYSSAQLDAADAKPVTACCFHAAAQNAGDRAQVGTVEIPDGSWVDELHPAWRSHMNTHLSILGSKSELRMQPKSSTRQGAPLAVPLDQGSVNGIVQNTDNEEVRRQVS